MERETERDQMERYREMKRYREMAPSFPPSPGPDFTAAESNTNTDFHNNSSQFKVKLGLGLGLGILGLLVIALIYYLYIKNKTQAAQQAAQQAATELEMVQRTLTQRVFVDSFPVSVYSLPEEGIDTDECSICCTEFESGSSLMLLPFCRHVFHRGCMASYWAHLTRERPCPICRHDYETWQPDVS